MRENNNQILHGDQTKCQEIFLPGLPRMRMRNLFVVANLLINSS